MKKIKEFLQKEAVFSCAALAAAVSAVFVPPSAEYIGYINFSVLGLLFALMAVVAGLSRLNVFTRAAEEMVARARGGIRPLAFVLWGLCFFGAAFITNDVALITFVPLAITLLTLVNAREYIINVVVLQTAAANLGSMLTPIGNPQNLYLYDTFGLSAADFFGITLPYGLFSLLVLTAATFLLVKNKAVSLEQSKKTALGSKKMLAVYILLAAVCLLSVGKILDYRAAVAAAAVFMLVFDRENLKKIDWFLLLTFVMFFVFVGNISAIDAVKNTVSRIITGREVISAVLLSQVISNVPCAAMLSGFTDNSTALIIGTNIGGLGTLVASLASLISFRLYCAECENADKKCYLLRFGIVNIIFLLILLAFYGIVG